MSKLLEYIKDIKCCMCYIADCFLKYDKLFAQLLKNKKKKIKVEAN